MADHLLRYTPWMHPLRPGLSLLTVLAATAVLPIAVASQTTSPAPALESKPSNGGIISGQVTSVDYQRGILGVKSGGKNVDVIVLPSTNIQGHGNGYHSIAEIVRGDRVDIFTSLADGKYTAQIIRLK
jgi:hypothetical protein